MTFLFAFCLGIGVALLGTYFYLKSRAKIIQQNFEDFTSGQYDRRLSTQVFPLFREVILSFNDRADKLKEEISRLIRQRNERLAVLGSMVEGVIAVDLNEKILSTNTAATQLLGLNDEKIIGKTIQEVIRNYSLQQFFLRALESSSLVEADVVLHEREDRILQVRGTVLKDEASARLGALIVLNDVTHIRRLENVRQDFVANVSHELKTPLTTMKGFVETLLNGALENPNDAKRFLEIISRHVERLGSIVENLLELTRIEETSGEGGILLRLESAEEAIERAIRVSQEQAEERGIIIEARYDKQHDLKAQIHVDLLEQALVNLIENAIKFSSPDARVRIDVYSDNTELQISVCDEGCGIPQEHLGRIFERFYRVDRGRSRKDGGVGLGLAITKHIVMAHHGRVTVESVVGKGSTFTIHIPKQTLWKINRDRVAPERGSSNQILT